MGYTPLVKQLLLPTFFALTLNNADTTPTVPWLAIWKCAGTDNALFQRIGEGEKF